MSLKVWLPLNGTLENKGCSNITVTNNGATVNTSGKIGSCYAFNGSTEYIALSGTQLFNIFTGGTQQFSIAMWVYHADATRAILFGDYSTSGAINFNIELSTSHGARFYWNASPDVYPSNAVVAASAWTHLVLTYDGTKVQSYINGVAKGTWTGTLGAKNKTSGEFRLGRDNRSDTTAFNGKMNDFRIYDHCLSAAEVHEISQGLVLHYKLDGSYVGSHNNLLPCGDTYTKTTPRTVTSNKIDGYSWVPNSAFEAKPSTTYTISVECDGTLASTHAQSTDPSIKSWTFWLYICNTNTTKAWATGSYDSAINLTNNNNNYRKIGNAHVWTYTLSSTQQYISLRTNNYSNGSDNLTVNYWNMKVEEGNIYTPWVSSTMSNNAQICDSSGYGHHGTIINTLILENDTQRYHSALYGGNNTGAVNTTLDPTWLNTYQLFTCNVWIKKKSMVGSDLWNTIFRYANSNTKAQQLHLCFKASTVLLSRYSDDISVPYTIPINEWIMMTWTCNGRNESLYINGVLKQSVTHANDLALVSSSKLMLYKDTVRNNYGSDIVMSDFRLYATELSANDIKALYEVGAKIDNKGNLHSYELNETKNNIMFKVDSARAAKIFQDGLSSYTQSKCKVTLTDDGYRIYRDPDLVYSTAGKVMWGGLKIVNQSADGVHVYNASTDNTLGLQEGHTYLFAFHAKGQSSNSPGLRIESNMGWDRIAGVGPNPTYLATKTIPANFNGEQDCYFIFTINDTLIKTATETKGGYTTGSQYLSYRHFCLNYDYWDTGALGTDLYLTDFRLYDVTDYVGKIQKTGISSFSDFVEQNGICQLRNKAELLGSNFIEF